jgi:hypothetical protein
LAWLCLSSAVWLGFGLATGFGSIRSGLEIGNAGSVYFL